MARPNGILLTERDAARLERSIIAQLLCSPSGEHDATELEAILDEAAVVPATCVDPQVVTMNSVVVLEDLPSARRLTVTLAYPRESDPARLRVSVLSAVGRALLGAHVGDVISTEADGDESGRYLVAEIRYQPEAAGRFDL